MVEIIGLNILSFLNYSIFHIYPFFLVLNEVAIQYDVKTNLKSLVLDSSGMALNLENVMAWIWDRFIKI